MEGFRVQLIIRFTSAKTNFRIIRLLLISALPQIDKELHSPIKALTVTEPSCHGLGILAMARRALSKIPGIGIADMELIRLRLLLPMMTGIEMLNRRLSLSQLKRAEGEDRDKDILKIFQWGQR